MAIDQDRLPLIVASQIQDVDDQLEAVLDMLRNGDKAAPGYSTKLTMAADNAARSIRKLKDVMGWQYGLA